MSQFLRGLSFTLLSPGTDRAFERLRLIVLRTYCLSDVMPGCKIHLSSKPSEDRIKAQSMLHACLFHALNLLILGLYEVSQSRQVRRKDSRMNTMNIHLSVFQKANIFLLLVGALEIESRRH